MKQKMKAARTEHEHLPGLDRLKGKPKKCDIIGFDIETTGKDNDFLIAGFVSEKGYQYTLMADKAVWHLKRQKRKKTKIYATNAEFDVVGTCWNTAYFYEISLAGSRGRTTWLSIGHKGRKATVCDTLSHVKMSVKAMGEYIGKPKLPSPKCFGREPETEEEWSELKAYNQRDCEITREFMLKYQEKINTLGGNLKSTISACGMDIFRRKYMKHSIIKEFPKEHPSMRDRLNVMIHRAYYGGRTECFSRGLIKDYKLYDVNSLYPAMMLKSYPKPISAKYAEYPGTEMRLIQEYEGVSEVIIQSPMKLKYPLLPVRKGAKLFFPLGRWKGSYTHIELRKAVSLGYTIRKILKTIYYQEDFKPFQAYIHAIYGMRKEAKATGDKMLDMVAKLLLNSLYGKWAQRPAEKVYLCKEWKEIKAYKGRKEIYPCWKSFEHEGVKPDYYKVIMLGKEPKNYIPIFSAYISSYGRILMHNLLTEYEGIYMDTDSIITKREIPTGTELGELKLEKAIKTGVIVRPKFYMLETADNQYIKVKGVSQADIDAFDSLMKSQPVSREKFLKLRESIARHAKPNKIVTVLKRLSLEDDKRVWPATFNPLCYQESEPIRI